MPGRMRWPDGQPAWGAQLGHLLSTPAHRVPGVVLGISAEPMPPVASHAVLATTATPPMPLLAYHAYQALTAQQMHLRASLVSRAFLQPAPQSHAHLVKLGISATPELQHAVVVPRGPIRVRLDLVAVSHVWVVALVLPMRRAVPVALQGSTPLARASRAVIA